MHWPAWGRTDPVPQCLGGTDEPDGLSRRVDAALRGQAGCQCLHGLGEAPDHARAMCRGNGFLEGRTSPGGVAGAEVALAVKYQDGDQLEHVGSVPRLLESLIEQGKPGCDVAFDAGRGSSGGDQQSVGLVVDRCFRLRAASKAARASASRPCAMAMRPTWVRRMLCPPNPTVKAAASLA
jgi:hypothetical protein